VFHNRIHWAKFYMSKAGLIDSPRRGWFIASDEGRRLLAAAPERIDNERLLQFPAFKAFYRGGAHGDEVAGTPTQVAAAPTRETPEETIEAAHAAIHAALRAELLARIQLNTPTFFEQVIVDLLVAMGYGGSHRNAAEQLGRSGDGGVDGVVNEDRLGLDRVYVQAKRYASTTVGRPEVQAFLGSLVGLGAGKGVFVTTSTFSAQAIEFVRHLPQRIILIDGPTLADLMIEHNVGVRLSRVVEFKRIDEDFFAEEE
jgi:restriction system protein